MTNKDLKIGFVVEYFASVILLVFVQYLITHKWNDQSLSILVLYSFVKLVWVFNTFFIMKTKL